MARLKITAWLLSVFISLSFASPAGASIDLTDALKQVQHFVIDNDNSGRMLSTALSGQSCTYDRAGRMTNVTPGGRTITFHAADRMVKPPRGRVPSSIAEVDHFLDTATRVRKISPHPLGDTITLQNTNSPIKEVVVDAVTGQRVITVITPKVR